MSEPAWEHFEHGADIGVRGSGRDPAEAFAAAGRALLALVTADPERIESRVGCEFELQASTLESLLVAFLNELIFRLDTERLLLGHLEPVLEGQEGHWTLHVRARGERYDPLAHDGTVEPKGATYTGLRVAGDASGWVAECVIDV